MGAREEDRAEAVMNTLKRAAIGEMLNHGVGNGLLAFMVPLVEQMHDAGEIPEEVYNSLGHNLLAAAKAADFVVANMQQLRISSGPGKSNEPSEN